MPKGVDGVVVIDYESPPPARKGTQRPNNSLFARAAVCHAGSESADADAIAELSGWSYERYVEGHYDERLAELVDEVTHPALRDSLQAVAQVRVGNPVAPRQFDGLRRHVVLHDSLSLPELAYSELGALESMLNSVLTTNDAPEVVGTLIRDARDMQRSLVGEVRNRVRGERDHFLPRAGEPLPSGEERVLSSVRLGSFKSDDAIKTFPAQLAVLKSLARTSDPRLRLEYTLRAESVGRSDPAAYFDVHLIGSGLDDGEAEEVSESLGQLLTVGLVAGWSLSAAPPPAEIGRDERVIWLALSGGADGRRPQPAIAEDWSLIVDFLRTQRDDIALTLSAAPLLAVGAGEPHLPDPEVDSFDKYLTTFGGFARAMQDAQASSTGFVEGVDRRAAGFLWRVALAEDSHRGLLRVKVRLVGRNATVPLARSIGSLIFGGAQFVVEDEVGRDVESILTSAEALRIFHPPYAAIQGRGLPNRRATSVSYKGISPVPTSGTLLGQVRVAGARVDRWADFFLPDEVRLRHTYILGRTGSGKTNLLKNLVRDDLESGRSLVVIDPHGSLAEYCARHADRYGAGFAFVDLGAETTTAANVDPFSLDDDGTRGMFDRTLDEVTEILRSLSYHQFTGPRFVSLLRLVFQSLRASPQHSTDLATAASVLESAQRRNELAASLGGSDLGTQWQSLFRTKASDLEELMQWATAKLSVFAHDEHVRGIVGSGPATTSIERFLSGGPSDRRCLAIRLPEWRLGSIATGFIGRLLIARLRRARFGREVEEGELITALYVDEFQKFVSADFETFLAESRKFGISLTLANQNLEQLTQFDEFEGGTSYRLREAVLGNVGCLGSFSVGGSDRQRLAEELDVEVGDIRDVAPFEALVRVGGAALQTGPFTLRIADSRAEPGSPGSETVGLLNALANRQRTPDSKPSGPGPDEQAETADDVSGPLRLESVSTAPATKTAPVAAEAEELELTPAELREFIDDLANGLSDETSGEADWLSRHLHATSVSAVPSGLAERVRSVIGAPMDLASTDVQQLFEASIGPQFATRLLMFGRPSWCGDGLAEGLIQKGIVRTTADAIVSQFGSLAAIAAAADADLRAVPGVGPSTCARVRELQESEPELSALMSTSLSARAKDS